jgi:hypothetical protein
MYEAGSGSILNRTCATADPTVGAACDLSQVGNMNTAGQCGHTLVCSKTSEMGGTCITPFSLAKGKYCSSPVECKKDLFCSADNVCEPIFTAEGETRDELFNCCPRGYATNCPHVSRGSVTKEKCYIEQAQQSAYVRANRWPSVDSKVAQALQDARCQVGDAGYACYDAINPQQYQAKCSSKYAGFASYASAANGRYVVSHVLVATCVLFAMIF